MTIDKNLELYGQFINSSDLRLKDLKDDLNLDIRDIANAPSKFFNWKRDGREDVGSVAQYWRDLNPLLAHEGRDGMLGMDYGKIALLSVISAAKKIVDFEEKQGEYMRLITKQGMEIASLKTMIANLKEIIENHNKA